MSTTDNGQQVSTPLLILLGVVAGGAALFALWTFVISPLLTGGDAAPDVVAGPSADPDGAVPDPGAIEPSATPPDTDDLEAAQDLLGEPVPETFEIFTARDPFQQLVVVATGATGTATVVPADVPDDADPAATPSPSGPAVSQPAGSSDDDDAPDAPELSDGQPPGEDEDLTTQGDGGGEIFQPAEDGTTTVALDQVTLVPGGPDRASLRIDEDSFEVAEGEVFAERFQLLDLDGACATLLFGDARFTICEGETISR